MFETMLQLVLSLLPKVTSLFEHSELFPKEPTKKADDTGFPKQLLDVS